MTYRHGDRVLLRNHARQPWAQARRGVVNTVDAAGVTVEIPATVTLGNMTMGVTYFSRSGIIDSQFVTLTETEAAIRLRPSPFE